MPLLTEDMNNPTQSAKKGNPYPLCPMDMAVNTPKLYNSFAFCACTRIRMCTYEKQVQSNCAVQNTLPCICSAQFANFHNFEIALHKLEIASSKRESDFEIM